MNNEWYTPPSIIIKARMLLGSIDLDPASCSKANKIVEATKYYTKENNGLIKEWRGNVWLNPPFSRGLIDEFIGIAQEMYFLKYIKQALILVNNSTDATWFHSLLKHHYACFLSGRLSFIDQYGKKVENNRQGQVIFHLGNDYKRFTTIFSIIGLIVKNVSNVF